MVKAVSWTEFNYLSEKFSPALGLRFHTLNYDSYFSLSNSFSRKSAHFMTNTQTKVLKLLPREYKGPFFLSSISTANKPLCCNSSVGLFLQTQGDPEHRLGSRFLSGVAVCLFSDFLFKRVACCGESCFLRHRCNVLPIYSCFPRSIKPHADCRKAMAGGVYSLIL